MKKFILYSFSALLLIALVSFNVMKVQDQQMLIGTGSANTNFNVTIGNDESRRSALYVRNTTSVTSGDATAIHAYQKAVASQSIAVRAEVAYTSIPNSYTYGVYANSGNGSYNNYGVYAFLYGKGSAIYGSSSGYSNSYAGFFSGDVFVSERMGIGRPVPSASSSFALDVGGGIAVNGSLVLVSDARQKTNVKDFNNSMELIEKLRPVTYNFKPYDYAEFRDMLKQYPPDSTAWVKTDADVRKFFKLNKQIDTKRKHIGFIAQELKQIFPEMVFEYEKGKLGVDYISLIPVLVSAVQELNEKNKEQDRIIQEMNRRLEALENNNNSVGNLQANIPQNMSFSIFPNPASGFVTVDYTLYADLPVSIELFDSFGVRVKLFAPLQNQKAGAYNVQYPLAGLNTGAYIVKVTAGNQIDAKQLIINN